MENMLKMILEKLQSLEVGQHEFRKEMAESISTLNKKLDHISEQVAQNTEYQNHVNNLSKKVQDLETDIKVIKKAITNQ